MKTVLAIGGVSALQIANQQEQSLAADEGGASHNALNKLVNQLKGMQTAVSEEQEQERLDHKKRMCYCNTNTEQKEKAVKKANEVISATKAALADADGTIAAKTIAVADAEKQIKQDSNDLTDLRKLRAKDNEQFNEKNIETTKNVKALESALIVLEGFFGDVASRDQAAVDAQQEAKQHATDSQAAAKEAGFKAFLQKKSSELTSQQVSLVSRLARTHLDMNTADSVIELLQNAANPKKMMSLIAQMPGGAHNAQSGQILGMMKELFNQMNKDWTELKQTENEAQADFSKDAAAREESIADLRTKKDADEKTLQEAQQVKADGEFKVEQKTKAVAADSLFLKELHETCDDAEEIFADNQKMRTGEEAALTDVIKELTSDATRNLFKGMNSPSFVQVESSTRIQNDNLKNLRQKLISAFRASGDQTMLQLSQQVGTFQQNGVGLNAFDKLKASFTALQKQLEQKREDEVKQRDTCISQSNELQQESVELEGSLEKTTTEKKLNEDAKTVAEADLEQLHTDATAMAQSLQDSSDDYVNDSKTYQKAVAEGKAMAKVLKVAHARMAKFYDTQGTALIQTNMLSQQNQKPKPITRAKSNGESGGVLNFMEQMIVDFQDNVARETAEEQKTVDDYAKMHKDSMKLLDGNGAEQSRTVKTIADRDSDILEASQNIKALLKDHENNQRQIAANHNTCNFLVKNFDTRQNGYTVEIEAIQEAKAILSGMQ